MLHDPILIAYMDRLVRLIACPHALQDFIRCESTTSLPEICNLLCKLAQFKYDDWGKEEPFAVGKELVHFFSQYDVVCSRGNNLGEGLYLARLDTVMTPWSVPGYLDASEEDRSRVANEFIGEHAEEVGYLPIGYYGQVTRAFFNYCGLCAPERYKEIGEAERSLYEIPDTCDECYPLPPFFSLF